MRSVLFGFKHCGKTYYGKLLAQELGVPFIDTDALIEKRTGENIRELHQRLGELAFRSLEKETILSLEAKAPGVISLGGGAILDPDSVIYLQSIGTLIYLRTDKATLKQRIFASSPLPSYLDPDDPESSYEKIYAERLSIYESIPAAAVDTSEKSDREILATLRSILQH